jgi:hypothetical protein
VVPGPLVGSRGYAFQRGSGLGGRDPPAQALEGRRAVTSTAETLSHALQVTILRSAGVGLPAVQPVDDRPKGAVAALSSLALSSHPFTHG